MWLTRNRIAKKWIGKWKGEIGKNRLQLPECAHSSLSVVSVQFLSLFRLSVFELLDVALLDLLHETFAIKEVTEEIRGELPRDGENLIVGDFRKRYGTTRGNQV